MAKVVNVVTTNMLSTSCLYQTVSGTAVSMLLYLFCFLFIFLVGVAVYFLTFS